MNLKNKTVVGLTEKVKIRSNDLKKEKTVIGRIDTGATMSSIHTKIVNELGLGPVLSSKKVKNANGVTIRPVIEINIVLHRKHMKCNFTVTDRSHMKYEVLIGRNILQKGFLIDPSIEQTGEQK